MATVTTERIRAWQYPDGPPVLSRVLVDGVEVGTIQAAGAGALLVFTHPDGRQERVWWSDLKKRLEAQHLAPQVQAEGGA